MKTKTKIKIATDILMTVTLLFVSGYQLWGDFAHEWAGALMFVLFIAHHVLNISWYKNLFKGKYSAARIFKLILNVFLFAIMLIQMYSGIVLSRHVFSFLEIESGLALARRLHILGAYWGFVLMSLHLGQHWSIFIHAAKSCVKIKKASPLRQRLLFTAGLLVSVYGAFVFADRDFLSYMLLKSEFVFLDYNEPALLFYLDYLSLMGLCIFISHNIFKLCKYLRGRKERKT